jgi:hypothetical protein
MAMRIAIFCAAALLAISGSAHAKDKKDKAVTTAAEMCADAELAKAKKLDCSATGTIGSDPASQVQTKRDAPPEPRLGYSGNPWFVIGF